MPIDLSTSAQFVEILSEKAFFFTDIEHKWLKHTMWSVNDVHKETQQKPNMAGFLQNRPNELVYFDGICHGGFPAVLKKYITDAPQFRIY